MKNKTVQRVLSFCLALLLCFTWNIAEPLVANAFAIELGWVTWALISFMAASGFTFAVTGGIDALKAEVDEKVDTYYQVKGIDLYQLIVQSLRFNNNNNGQPGFWFTIAAITAIREFLVWLKSDQLWDGNVSELTSGYYVPIEYGTITVDNVIQPIKLITDSNGNPYKRTTGSGWTSLSPQYSCGTLVPYPNGFSFNYGGADVDSHASEFYYSDDGFCKLRSNDSTISLSIDNLLSQLNCTIDEFAGVTFFLNEGTSYSKTQNRVGLAFVKTTGWIYLTNTWVVLETSTGSVSSFYEYKEQGFTITIPETIPEFDVEENQLVEISFDAFPDNVTYESPEEFAEAVKQHVIDTGTVPSIKTEVVTDPDADPQPSPVIPPPDQTDPNYPDVGDLGLPSLGDALKSKFPFSLPWTFGAILGIFLAPRQTPKWEVELPAPLSTSFTIDLSPYEEVGYISRWMSDIGFAIALLLATRKFIHW